MVVAFWLAVYLLARGRSNRLTFRVVIILAALAFYFFMVFTAEVNPGLTNPRLRSGAMMIAIVTAHNLTYLLLPDELQKKYHGLSRAVIFGALIAAAFVIAAPIPERPSPFTISLPTFDSFSVVPSLYLFLVSVGILYNLLLVRRTSYQPLNRAFYLALLMGLCSVAYGAIATVLSIQAPRIVSSIFMLGAFLLMVYSITRFQVLIERRTVSYDLTYSFLTITGLTLLGVLVVSRMHLTGFEITVVAIVLIATLSIYDLVREALNRRYQSQVLFSWRQVHEHAYEPASESNFDQNLDRILHIFSKNIQATSAFIAIRDTDGFQVRATRGSLPVNSSLPSSEVQTEQLTRANGSLETLVKWIVPAYAGFTQLAVLGVGSREGLKDYTQSDFHWMEDVADHIALMVYTAQSNRRKEQTAARKAEINVEMISTLTAKPDSRMIKEVETCPKNLHDYPQLGKSRLADLLCVDGNTHIERGHALHDVLVETIESLRPSGDRPSEPLPREWYNFVILHDAYVEDVNDREVMARLYISEGTYYRTRRKALRGVTRALVETAEPV